MNRGAAEPGDEGRFVELHEQRRVSRGHEGEGHARREDGERGQDEPRGENPQQRTGWAGAPVLWIAGVVADEPISRRPELQRHWTEKEKAEDVVKGKQPVNPQDGDALNGQQNKQGHPGE